MSGQAEHPADDVVPTWTVEEVLEMFDEGTKRAAEKQPPADDVVPTWTVEEVLEMFDEGTKRAAEKQPPAESVPLQGVALNIWQAVTYRGEHLVLSKDGRPVAVVLPVEDLAEMRRRIDGRNGG